MNALFLRLRLIFSASTQPTSDRRQRRTRLAVEVCEDRTLPSQTALLEVARPKFVLDTAIVESPSKDLGEIKSTFRRSDDTKSIKRLERRFGKRKPPAPPISTLSENQPPVVSMSPGPPVFLTQASMLTVSITDPDEPGDQAFGYTMTVTWGDGTAPTILSNPHPFYQTLTHTYAQSGNWIVTELAPISVEGR